MCHSRPWEVEVADRGWRSLGMDHIVVADLAIKARKAGLRVGAQGMAEWMGETGVC